MQTTFSSIREQYYRVSEPVVNLSFLAQAAARCYTAWVFFASGLTKLRDWETTLFLFEYEYSVPVLSPELAAYLATIGEIVLPILLVAGLASRVSAAGLSIINVVAVLSLEDIPAAAMYLHYIWGILLAQIVVWGGGVLSLDRWLNRRREF
ncbi:MAG: DoxX family protein [Haliea sp.]|uniref:DoxX family protein n=1 Tax=Haliea sp. TaxID=1932666 RepID=UPI0032EFC494